MVESQIEKVKKVKAIFSDVDGILTDGSIYLGENGFELKRFTVHDGVGAAMARIANLPIALISGRESGATSTRAAQLQITEVYQGYINKIEPFNVLLEKFDLQPEEVAYIGDGYIDLVILERVGVPISVPEAPAEVQAAAMYITQRKGGEGVLMEVVEWILTNQGRKDEVMAAMKKKISMTIKS